MSDNNNTCTYCTHNTTQHTHLSLTRFNSLMNNFVLIIKLLFDFIVTHLFGTEKGAVQLCPEKNTHKILIPVYGYITLSFWLIAVVCAVNIPVDHFNTRHRPNRRSLFYLYVSHSVSLLLPSFLSFWAFKCQSVNVSILIGILHCDYGMRAPVQVRAPNKHTIFMRTQVWSEMAREYCISSTQLCA